MANIQLSEKDIEVLDRIKEEIDAPTRTETIRHLIRLYKSNKNG